MATLALGLAGAGIGSFFGAPALGFTLGTAVGSLLFGRGGNTPEPPRLEDKSIMSSALGSPIPRAWGTEQFAGEVIWAIPIRETELEEDIGKGGSNTVKTFSYSATFAVAFSRGPLNDQGIIGVRRIWADAKLIYDFSEAITPAELYAANQAASGIVIYPGSQSQDPSAVQEADRGAGNVPAYRGTVYIEFVDMNIDEFGARVPSIRAEIVYTQGNESFLVNPAWTERPPSGAQSFYYEDGGTLTYGAVGSGPNTGFSLARSTWTVDGRLIDDRTVEYTGPHSGTVQVYGPVRNTGIDGLEVAIGTAPNASAAATLCWLQDRFALADAGASPGGGQLFDENLVALGFLVWDRCWFDPRRELIFVLTDDATDARAIIFDVVQVPEGIVLSQTARTSYTPAGGNHAVDVHPSVFGVFVLEDGTTPKIVEIDPATEPPTVLTTWTGVTGGTAGALPTLLVDESILPMRATICTGNSRAYFVYELPDGGGTAGLLGNGDVSDPASHVADPARIAPNLTHHRAQHVTTRLLTQGTVDIKEIITDVCALVGITSSDLNVGGVTETMGGFRLTRESSARQVLEPLVAAYQLDVTETDGQLKFTSRSTGAVAATIAEDDLAATVVAPGAGVPGEIVDQVLHRRRQDDELPRTVTIRYRNPGREYESNGQLFPVQNARAQNHVVIELAGAITDDEAAAMAERVAMTQWIERDQFDISLGAKWIALDPGDALDVRGRRMRVIANDGNWDDMLFKLQLVADDPVVMSTTTQGNTDPNPPTPGVPLAGTSFATLLDIPLLRDADVGVEVGFYFDLSAVFDGWPGAVLLRSIDEGTTWQEVGAGTVNAPAGYATTALADGPSGFDWNQTDWSGTGNQPWDATSTVDVRLSSIGTLDNASQAEILTGSNTGLLGTEIIGWQTASDLGGGLWRLGGLLRGRRGTQEGRLTHAVNELFAVLSVAVTGRVAHGVDEMNRSRLYRAPTMNADLTTGTIQAFTNTGISLRPFSVVNLAASRPPVGTGWTVTLSWLRRSRYGNEYRNFATDVPPLDAPDERYDVEIWNSAGTELKRTETVIGLVQFAYTEPKQNTDFGDAGQAFQARIYQLNADYPSEESRGPANVLQFAGFTDGGPKDPTTEPIPNEDEDFLVGETLAAGDLVNVYNDNGARLRKAKSDSGIRAHGYVLEAVTSGQSATLHTSGINTAASTTVGAEYYLSTAGGISTTRPTAAGHIVQRVGVGTSTGLLFDAGSVTERIA